MAVNTFDVINLGKAGLLDPAKMGYTDSLEIIKDESFKIQKSFVKIGWYLKHIRDNELYKEGGYANIYECAADQLGYSQSTASRFINICEKFSKNHNSPELDTKYAGFDKSQMIEMLPMGQEQLEEVTPDMTVAEIRAVKNERATKAVEEKIEADLPGQTSIEKDFPEYLPETDISKATVSEREEYATSHKNNESNTHNEDLVESEEDDGNEIVIDGTYREILVEKSAYGLPKTEYPEGSLISTEGCGNMHHCFSCAQICNIRQKERYCVGAPLGNPYPCTTMNYLDKMNVENAEMCQFINHDLAEHTSGSNEATPCCKKCDQYECIFRCEKAAKPQVQKQAELPLFKNNDQRKEWLKNYKEWGLWYRDENIDVNYYKFDFADDSRLVVAEYPKRAVYYDCNKLEDEYYYHLLEKNKKGYQKTYDEVYRHNSDCETYLVDFLKNLQKSKK